MEPGIQYELQGERLHVADTEYLREGHAWKIRFKEADGGTMEGIVLCRLNGVLYALDSLCPHEGGRLAEGPLMDGRYAYCPLHLFKYDPRNGRVVDVDCPDVPAYAVTESNGGAEIWIREPDQGED